MVKPIVPHLIVKVEDYGEYIVIRSLRNLQVHTVKRLALTFLFVFPLTSKVNGAGIFDGSSNLTTADNLVGSAPGYPVLFACWVKLNNVTANHSLIYTHDNNAGGSLDMLELLARGDVVNDPIQWRRAAAGSFADRTHGTLSASTWYFVAGYSPNNSGQTAYIGTASTTNSVVRNVSSLAETKLGAGAGNPLNGRLAEVVVAHGFSAGDITTIITALAGGARPSDVPELSGAIDAYQPLRTGLNDAGYVGPSWTNNGVTFDAADHPIEYGRVIKVLLQSSGSQ